MWIDATYVQVRQGGRIVNVAVIIATGDNTEGRREVLRLAVLPSEAEPFWKAFLRSLADRGLRSGELIVADGHKGLRAAANKMLHGSLQLCRVHFMRNCFGSVPSGQSSIVTAMLRTIFAQDTHDAAHAAMARGRRRAEAAGSCSSRTTSRACSALHAIGNLEGLRQY